VEYHALDRNPGVQHLQQVPRDGLALTILIGGEYQFARILEQRLELLHMVGLTIRHYI